MLSKIIEYVYRKIQIRTSFIHAVVSASLIAIFSSAAQGECNFFTGFTDNKDGTVTDTRSGLIWKRCAEGEVFQNGVCTGNAIRMKWNPAMKEATQSQFLNENDWRLPTKSEFDSVIAQPETERNCEVRKVASIAIFNNPKSDQRSPPELEFIYWSSDVGSHYSEHWTVSILDGRRISRSENYDPPAVRLVRMGQIVGGEASPEFVNEIAIKLQAKKEEQERLALEQKKEQERRAIEQKEQYERDQRRQAEWEEQEKNRLAREKVEAKVRGEKLERDLVILRKSLKAGDRTNRGLIIQLKGELVKVQVDPQCAQYGGQAYGWRCLSYTSTEEKWVRRSEINRRN